MDQIADFSSVLSPDNANGALNPDDYVSRLKTHHKQIRKRERDKYVSPTTENSQSESDPDRTSFRSIIFDETLTEEVMSGEIVAYFYHLYRFYEQVADVTFFLHNLLCFDNIRFRFLKFG